MKLKKPKNKEPEDLGVKVGTPDEVLWTKVKNEAEMLIEQSKDSLKIQSAILKLAEEKIATEQEKIKKLPKKIPSGVG